MSTQDLSLKSTGSPVPPRGIRRLRYSLAGLMAGAACFIIVVSHINTSIRLRQAEHSVAAQQAELARLRDETFDVLIMDVEMPGMDGMETSRRVRALGLDPEPYIIALTAHASSEIRSRCLAAGMNDHLAKPLHRPALERSLAAAAASRG